MPLEIKLTDFCNLSCTYCYYKNQMSRSVMPYEMVIQSVSWYLGHTRNSQNSAQQKKGVSITFFGGEPLLCFATMCRTVDYFTLHSIGNIPIHWIVCTNGTLLDEHSIAELRRRHVIIVLSLDGPKEVHNTHRVGIGGECSFEQLKVPVTDLALTVHSVETVISPVTAERLYESITWLWDTGFTRIIAIPDFIAKWTPEEMDVLFNQYEKIAADYYQRVKNGTKPYFSIIDDKIALARNGLSYKKTCCTFGRETFVIDTRGLIYPCTRFACDLPDNKYDIGRITVPSTASVLYEEKRQGLIAKHTQPRHECEDCSYASRCLANQCACISFSLFDTITGVSPAVCTHERYIIALSDNLAEKLYGLLTK